MKPKLETMFLELKDTFEMVVDLAYSSLLYDNAEIAEEVITLNDSMEELPERIQDEIEEAATNLLDIVDTWKSKGLAKMPVSFASYAV